MTDYTFSQYIVLLGAVAVLLLPYAPIGLAILSPYFPSGAFVGMPLLLIFSAVFNLNIDWLNYWYSSAKLTSLPWWNILNAVLSIIGILPSFILVLPGFIGIFITFLLTPIWAGLEILFVIYMFIDPSIALFAGVLNWVICVLR